MKAYQSDYFTETFIIANGFNAGQAIKLNGGRIMGKVNFYIFFGLIVFVGLLILTGCSSDETIGHDGGTYIGKVKDGLPHGQGTWTGFDRNVRGYVVYIGKFKNGVRDGKGTMTTESGHELYVGEWKLGFMHGQGTFTWGKVVGNSGFVESRIKYVGEWKAGLPHGQGTMAYHDGRKVTGQWERGEYIGP